MRLEAGLLEVATRLFMERGFEGTSMDAVAETAGVSKPTVYSRYRDKRELFAAVLRARIQHWLAPLSAAAEAQITECPPKDIETTLHELSRQMLSVVLPAECGALQRILAAQAVQFPELATLAHEEGWLGAVRGVSALLRRARDRGEISVTNPDLAADLFLNLVLGHSRHVAFYGLQPDAEAIERYRQTAVTLFLNGVKPRTDGSDR